MGASVGRPGQEWRPHTADGPELATPPEDASPREHLRRVQAALGSDLDHGRRGPKLIGRRRDLGGRWWHYYQWPAGQVVEAGPFRYTEVER